MARDKSATFPLPSGERRGPIAQRWGGEGALPQAITRPTQCACSNRPLTFPPLCGGPLPLPGGERGNGRQ
jgi:hypothetical protein